MPHIGLTWIKKTVSVGIKTNEYPFKIFSHPQSGRRAKKSSNFFLILGIFFNENVWRLLNKKKFFFSSTIKSPIHTPLLYHRVQYLVMCQHLIWTFIVLTRGMRCIYCCFILTYGILPWLTQCTFFIFLFDVKYFYGWWNGAVTPLAGLLTSAGTPAGTLIRCWQPVGTSRNTSSHISWPTKHRKEFSFFKTILKWF